METALYKKVEETIRYHEMLKRGDRVLVGVSGGPDSVFLLYVLCYLRDRMKIDVFVANLDHGIRGRASREDSLFVKRMSKDMSLKYLHKTLKLTEGNMPRKISVEEALRKKRYMFFKKAAGKVNANIVATGHTMDDQAETVLMRVIKGSTIKGLTGILPKSRQDGLCIIRPLIEIEKNAIMDFLSKRRIPYRIDHTNSKEKYFRNVVRKKILPYLLRYNPRLKRSLSLMAESLREDREFIEEEKATKSRSEKHDKSVCIRLKDIAVQPGALQREILRDALIQTGASVKKLTYRHWKDMRNFLKFKRKGQCMDLPGGVVMKRDEKTLLLSRVRS